MKTLTTRCVITFALLDVFFNPLAVLACMQLLGVGNVRQAYAIFAGCVLLKVIACALFIVELLKPFERFSRTALNARTGDLARRADHALQLAPRRFATFYGFSWFLTYAIGYLAFTWWAQGSVGISPRAAHAVGLLSGAVFFGSVAFGFPVMSMLTSDAAGQVSVYAREHGAPLDREPGSLQTRIGVIALCLALGPTLWMMALGYMKQVDADYAQSQARAAHMAAELARWGDAGANGSAPTGAEPLRALLARPEYSGVSAMFLDDSGAPVLASTEMRLRAGSPELAAIRQGAKAANHGALMQVAEERALAFQRMADSRVVIASVSAEAGGAASFAITAAVFAFVVALWAPLSAIMLGRAVSAPVERLTQAAEEIVEQGKQSQMGTLPVPRNDEVGLLSERFNDVLDMMRELSRAADAIASGDLRVTIDRKGELPDAFRGMLGSLRSMVRQIRETSVDLANAATEIFAASQEQEAAAASQSSAMEEISRTMDSLSDSAAHVSDAVQGVLGNAERTLRNTDEMVTRIGSLSAHTGRIGEILEVIQEIADKSDLLALNGSLEASRAGEHGHGFALVAAEMRRLAERVTASVQDVKKLVLDIRDSGTSTVMATEESKRLAEGTTDAARQITFVTQQQRSGTEQVSQSVKSIVDVVAQAVSATSQTRTSAEGLKSHADKLAQLVRRFEVVSGEHS